MWRHVAAGRRAISPAALPLSPSGRPSAPSLSVTLRPPAGSPSLTTSVSPSCLPPLRGSFSAFPAALSPVTSFSLSARIPWKGMRPWYTRGELVPSITAAAALVFLLWNPLKSSSLLGSANNSAAIHGGVRAAMAGEEGSSSAAVVVYVTVPNKETGQKLAKGLVEAKLAACVNQIPGVESTYWWQGKIETESEILLVIKTRQALLSALETFVKENHPYEVPEIIALPIIGGSAAYLNWLLENTQPS